MKHAFSFFAAAVLCSACAEDLTAVNASWDALQKQWSTTIAEAKKAHEPLATKAAGATVADADVAGKGLRQTADDALAAHKKVIADLDQILTETGAAVTKAQPDKKILPVQTAIDSGTKAWMDTVGKLTPALTAATAAVDALAKHAEEEAAKAAAAAADPAAKDPETVKTKDGTTTVLLGWTDKDAVDETASAQSLERLTKLLASCDPLQIEATGTGADEKAGKARADSLKKLFDGKGLKNKISATAGAQGDGVVTLKVLTPCP